MTQATANDQGEADTIFASLLHAQEGFMTTQRRTENELAEARKARDEAILDASRWGFTRRAVAQATALTVGRVQQIIDEHGGMADHVMRLPSGKRWRYPIGDPRRFQ
jgi:hypothetical protein